MKKSILLFVGFVSASTTFALIKSLKRNKNQISFNDKNNNLVIKEDNKESQIIDTNIKKTKEKTIELDYSKFNSAQIQQIRWGLEDGLDVSLYAKPELDHRIMHEIKKRFQWEKGSMITYYTKPESDFFKMNKILDTFEKIWYENKKKDICTKHKYLFFCFHLYIINLYN